MIKKLVLALAAVGMVVGGTVACSPTQNEDVSGQVVEREKEWKKYGKSYRLKYELDIVDANGDEHEIRVDKDSFEDCVNGSTYPECAD